jgi:hypothetical protein
MYLNFKNKKEEKYFCLKYKTKILENTRDCWKIQEDYRSLWNRLTPKVVFDIMIQLHFWKFLIFLTLNYFFIFLDCFATFNWMVEDPITMFTLLTWIVLPSECWFYRIWWNHGIMSNVQEMLINIFEW